MFWIACLLSINLQYYSMCSKYPPSGTHALRCARHFVNECVNDALLQYAVPSMYYRRCRNLLLSNDVIGIQKRQLSSNKSNKQKNLLVCHSKTKLSSDVSIVSIILANVNEHSSLTR